jgi:hypothetical protein
MVSLTNHFPISICHFSFAIGYWDEFLNAAGVVRAMKNDK